MTPVFAIETFWLTVLILFSAGCKIRLFRLFPNQYLIGPCLKLPRNRHETHDSETLMEHGAQLETLMSVNVFDECRSSPSSLQRTTTLLL
ncbi:uncharacterized protein FOBCDRAFT_219925 [Fusarium oxysporum Fo47]|uniref:uncharacterized protein n=1 Tax=Fusarium oxysporum Fo47 TaxID=660027 RepID=UPI002869C79E|nr:uncharacterized protein FOBCDRAFT_219925 [Fusarium oxysporum Fo47]WJG35128.1 hypothetical protein FOBCDRAFT_219925 [Fusarium oxysporum Fo47]